MKVLVTGGAGYIGSHTVIELVQNGYEVLVADNFSNSSPEALKRVEKILGSAVPSLEIDLCDAAATKKMFDDNHFDAIIHFAGLKAVGESVSEPLLYYRNNLLSTLNLLEHMSTHHINQFVFSSSATVYGIPETVPITEDFPLSATNPYGQTKLMIEQILKDYSVAHPEAQISLLRYFNPIGAHPSGTIGEDPHGIPNNLLPYVSQVAVGTHEFVRVWGNTYDTPDGTGVRDYIHVTDLAQGHVAALKHMPDVGTWQAYNLGTGHGYSVLDVIAAYEKAASKPIPYKILEPRAGDVASCFADASKAARELGWHASKTLEDACRDAWHWQSQNPNGFTPS